jgi:uncharacterized protein YdaU (DUF1376 family)
MHYYQHNIADYRKDTSHLTLLEHGAYRQLLDQYYLNEQPLSLDEIKIFRLLSAKTTEEKNAIKSVLGDFFTQTEAGYIHRRCEIEIQTFHSKSEVASKSAKVRWQCERNANAMPTHSERNANHKPLTINHKPLTNIDIHDDFERFWNAYPKKVGRQAALKAWNKTKLNIEEVLIALDWQKETDQWYKNGGQFIPNPATWINQGRYMDERPEQITF